MENESSEAAVIRKGDRQGRFLSPLIFNIFSETIFREALDDIREGIKVNGVVINIRYANDNVVFGATVAKSSNGVSDLKIKIK